MQYCYKRRQPTYSILSIFFRQLDLNQAKRWIRNAPLRSYMEEKLPGRLPKRGRRRKRRTEGKRERKMEPKVGCRMD